MFKHHCWHPYFTLALLNVHAGAVAALFYRPAALDLILAVAGYFWFGFASTLYYHRCLTHRSFELSGPLQAFFLLGGLIGLSGDPVRWAAVHRYHHQRPDHDDDIHSPRDGWWYAHFGWLARMDMARVKEMKILAQDLRARWYLRLFENPVAEVVPHLAYTALLVWWRGPRGLYWGLYVPVMLTYHFTWMAVASLGHMSAFGTRRSNTPDESRNLAWLGPFSLGESFHNNHHASPRRARHGIDRGELDPTGFFIGVLERLGLARNVFHGTAAPDVITPESPLESGEQG